MFCRVLRTRGGDTNHRTHVVFYILSSLVNNVALFVLLRSVQFFFFFICDNFFLVVIVCIGGEMGVRAVPKQAAAAGKVIVRGCPQPLETTTGPCRPQAPINRLYGMV